MAFPNVPNVPGVPSLPRAPGAFFPIPVAVGQEPVINGQQKPVWGVFRNDGTPVALFDSFIGIACRLEARVSDAPAENGAFSSYNKVNAPDRPIVRLACGGELAKRSEFIAALEAAKKSLDLFTVVTPEVVYTNVNIEGVNYQREQSSGATMLVVDLLLKEIRIRTARYTTTTRDPSGASATSGGKVQPQEPTARQKSALQDVIDFIGGLSQ